MTKTLIEKVTIAVYEANSYGSSLSEDEVEAAIRAVLKELSPYLAQDCGHCDSTLSIRETRIESMSRAWDDAILKIQYRIEQFAKENGIDL